MGTDPLHQKRGAATMLIQWGLDHCKQENVPAYLESTMEAVPLYEKMGFRVAARITLRFDERGDGTAGVYEEAACIFKPGIESL
jgi:GNAT superfamily N-acetyltransferase